MTYATYVDQDPGPGSGVGGWGGGGGGRAGLSKFHFQGKSWINFINLGHRIYLNIHTLALYLILLFNKSILLHMSVCKVGG